MFAKWAWLCGSHLNGHSEGGASASGSLMDRWSHLGGGGQVLSLDWAESGGRGRLRPPSGPPSVQQQSSGPESLLMCLWFWSLGLGPDPLRRLGAC